MSAIRLDAQLIRRYDLDVPPYTSYPAPPHFHSDFDVLAYRRAALLSNAGLNAFAAEVHAPPLSTAPEWIAEYLQCLQREMELQSELFDPRRLLVQLHLSGGATMLAAAALQQLLEHLDRLFRLGSPSEREFCVDIDPRTATPAMIEQLAAFGFTRANFGVPDFDKERDKERDKDWAAHGTASFVSTLRLMDAARDCGFRSLSFDLILGMPRQTRQQFAKLLRAVVAAKPERLTTYTYPHCPELYRMRDGTHSGRRPSASTRLAMRRLTVETLTQAGYVDIGMDRFAWPTRTHARYPAASADAAPGSASVECDLLAMGAGAVGRMGTSYAQNAKRLEDYCAALQRHVLPIECGVELTVDDVVRREVIQRIMCQRTLDFSAIGRRYALDFHSYFARELTQLRTLADDGLVIDSDTGFAVSERGQLLLQNITTVFDAYRHGGDRAAAGTG